MTGRASGKNTACTRSPPQSSRQQLHGLDERRSLVRNNVRASTAAWFNCLASANLVSGSDQDRSYYFMNMLILDARKAGFQRNQLVAALKREGVRARVWDVSGAA